MLVNLVNMISKLAVVNLHINVFMSGETDDPIMKSDKH